MVYCFILLMITYIIFFIYFNKPNLKNNNLPPSPPSFPIIGHIRLLGHRLHRSLESLSTRYGPILYLRLGRFPLLVVSTPSAAEECFATNDLVFANRPHLLSGKHFGYNYSSLPYVPYGTHLRTLRRAMADLALSSHQVQLTSDIREEETRFIIRQIMCGVTQKRVVDLNSLFCQLSHNVVMRVLNGKQWSVSSEVFTPQSSFNVCDLMPVLRWIGYGGLEERMINLSKRRDAMLKGLIDDYKQEREKKMSESGSGHGVMSGRKTMIDELLDLQEKDPDFFTNDILKGLVLAMITAGTDTSARTMEWAMSLLLNHPDVLEKVKSEIDTTVSTPRLVQDSHVLNLNYLRCVINETLRLFPVAPLLVPHFSSSDCTIGGYDIPKGTMLVVNVWALHRSPDVWKDPLKFMPERFIEVEGEGDTFRFMPFGAGRRVCPGANFAMRTVALVLARLIQCFEWEGCDGGLVDLDEGAGLTMPKSKPLEARCTPRGSVSSLLLEP